MNINRRSLLAGLFGATLAAPSLAEQIRAIPAEPQPKPQVPLVGYNGQSPFDAGLFYCPYVPLQMVRAGDPNAFQPAIGFNTRYGVIANA